MWVLYPPQSRRLRRLRDINDLSLLVPLPPLLSPPPQPLPPFPSLPQLPHLHSSPPLNPNPNPNPPIPTKAVSPEHNLKAHCLRSSVNLIMSLPRLRKSRPRPRPQTTRRSGCRKCGLRTRGRSEWYSRERRRTRRNACQRVLAWGRAQGRRGRRSTRTR